MKKLIAAFCVCLMTTLAFAQNQKTPPVLTTAFTDSLTRQIQRIAPPDLSISKLVYTSTISADGILIKPLIIRQIGGGTIAENDFVVALRSLIIAAPAWKPALDTDTGKAVEDKVSFTIELDKKEIKIKQNK
ncbi:hypothetical protein HDF23_004065 [Mucilaginibacter lappiensis]|uniref:TonB protein C-terminal n=1 Tax=Mucilaginibacter lappiensis TaxID=354630 RepID=A0ABR6PNE8_9SPHI|nr:hypothetical protein [Mucilaginibacter lappiensis]MBB6111297.1 hypothetical protein [Mucilaginibacter lappiensis]